MRFFKWFFFFFFNFLLFWPGRAARRILVPQLGIKPVPLHWKRGVLATGPPGKFPASTFLLLIYNVVSVSGI